MTSVSYSLGIRGDIAVPGDYDGGGRTDIAVFRPSTGEWKILTSTSEYATLMTLSVGATGDAPVPNAAVQYAHNAIFRLPATEVTRASDVDGDRRSDITFYRPSTGTWHSVKSAYDYTTSSSVPWGQSADTLAPGDYDGDGLTDPAVFTPSSGTWSILLSTTAFTTPRSVVWGVPNLDKPVPGDYDGDGKTDIAVYRYHPGISATGFWFIVSSSTGTIVAPTPRFGGSNDVTVTADYDGDGRTDIALFNPATARWGVLLSSTNFGASWDLWWGQDGDIAVPADYDGDGKADLAVYRPSNGTWYVLNSSTGRQTYFFVAWGVSTDIPVPGDFDGDGKADLAVYRPSTGTWFILHSAAGYSYASSTVIEWGSADDIPILRRP